jgi:hypothetical protein
MAGKLIASLVSEVYANFEKICQIESYIYIIKNAKKRL